MDILSRLIGIFLLGAAVFIIGGVKFYLDLFSDPIGLYNQFHPVTWLLFAFIGWSSFYTSYYKE